ncbi:unnamed protein product [Rotaria sp. Silwood1]|nr:unnamed protein product [Rotaria sp. Silwood1]CAF1584895.1 unnamed protein product [Rotaria sp. Silwood1]CAF3528244.1 unnamed protein product [Rotaria sp. Silwood1]CAF3819093.1 unnamed protein product [Rotaria sp. Silwood1]CAF4630198.1 unnamed protein product [Rotaria sp. Silwood1]
MTANSSTSIFKKILETRSKIIQTTILQYFGKCTNKAVALPVKETNVLSTEDEDYSIILCLPFDHQSNNNETSRVSPTDSALSSLIQISTISSTCSSLSEE